MLRKQRVRGQKLTRRLRNTRTLFANGIQRGRDAAGVGLTRASRRRIRKFQESAQAAARKAAGVHEIYSLNAFGVSAHGSNGRAYKPPPAEASRDVKQLWEIAKEKDKLARQATQKANRINKRHTSGVIGKAINLVKGKKT